MVPFTPILLMHDLSLLGHALEDDLTPGKGSQFYARWSSLKSGLLETINNTHPRFSSR